MVVVVRCGAVRCGAVSGVRLVGGREWAGGADGFIYCVIRLGGFVAVETEQVTWLLRAGLTSVCWQRSEHVNEDCGWPWKVSHRGVAFARESCLGLYAHAISCVCARNTCHRFPRIT
jgi:hypothetical protein